jgi:hypothetical protein
LITDVPKTSRAPATCERCGSILVIFEEHGDGDVIYCACSCMTDSGGVKAESKSPLCNRCGKTLPIFKNLGNGEAIYHTCSCAGTPPPPPSAGGARPSKASRRCGSCGAMIIVVGSRPDGSPIEAECPCQRAQRSDQDRSGPGAGPARPSIAPPKPETAPTGKKPSSTVPVFRTAEPAAEGHNLVMVGAIVLVVGAALAGLWVEVKGKASVPATSVGAAAASKRAAEAAVAPPESAQHDGVEIVNDRSGAVTLVSGDDPSAVLRGFCRHPQWKSALVPGGLQATTPPDPDLLLGSAVLMDGSSTLRQVILKRNPETKHWSIGDGKSPITLGNLPTAGAAAPSIAPAH